MPSFTFAQMVERDTKAAAARALNSQSGRATVSGDSCTSLGSVSSVGPGDGVSFEAVLRDALAEQVAAAEAQRLASRRQLDQALRGRRAVNARPSSAWRDGDTEQLDLTRTMEVAAPHVCVWCAEPDEEPLINTSRPGATPSSRGLPSGGLEFGGTRLAWSAPMGAAIDATAAWLSPGAPTPARGRIGVLCWDENSTSAAELSMEAQRAQAGGAVALLLLLVGERGRRWVPAKEAAGRRAPLGGSSGAAAELLPIDSWVTLPCVAVRGPHALRLREALRRCANLDALPVRMAPTCHAEATRLAAARHAALAALRGPPPPAKPPSKPLRPSYIPLPDGVDDWIRLEPMGDDPPSEEDDVPPPRAPPTHAHFWERQTVAQPNHYWGFPTGAAMPTTKVVPTPADPHPGASDALVARNFKAARRPRPGIFADGRPPSAPPKRSGVPFGPGF